jgi:hypothetical protein
MLRSRLALLTDKLMRNLALGFVLLLGAATPQFAWAGSETGRPSPAQPPDGGAGSQLRALLDHLDIPLIARARAAECKEEGKICKSNADCCSGLECTGEPETTCRPAE